MRIEEEKLNEKIIKIQEDVRIPKTNIILEAGDRIIVKEALEFSDGMKINTDGPLRITREYDGLYVVGNGMLIPVSNEREAEKVLNNMKTRNER